MTDQEGPGEIRRIESKLLPLAMLAEQVRLLRGKGKQVVLCHGTFDLLHIGHIRHLQRARREGDILIVESPIVRDAAFVALVTSERRIAARRVPLSPSSSRFPR